MPWRFRSPLTKTLGQVISKVQRGEEHRKVADLLNPPSNDGIRERVARSFAMRLDPEPEPTDDAPNLHRLELCVAFPVQSPPPHWDYLGSAQLIRVDDRLDQARLRYVIRWGIEQLEYATGHELAASNFRQRCELCGGARHHRWLGFHGLGKRASAEDEEEKASSSQLVHTPSRQELDKTLAKIQHAMRRREQSYD